MNRKPKSESPKRAIVEIALPILVSAATLAFGISQYIDKRSLEKSVLASEVRIKELDKRNKELEIQDDIQIKYIDTDMTDLYTLLNQTDEEGRIKIHGNITRSNVEEAINDWLKSIGKEMDIHITSLQMQPFQYFVEHVKDPAIFKNHMSLFLIHNAGKYKAKDVVANFTSLPDNKNIPIIVGEIGPKMGYIFIAAFTKADTQEPFGVRLIPGDLIEYTDDFSNEKKAVHIRAPYAIPRMIAPGLHWMR